MTHPTIRSIPLQRNPVLDIARGIGIICVVLGHNWFSLGSKGWLFQVLFSFHMPLFFFLSGLHLSGTTAWRTHLMARAGSLLKPYAATLFALVAIGALAGVPPGQFGGDVPGDARRIFYGVGEMLFWPWTPMWFLPHLFLVSCVALAVLKLRLPRPVLALGLLACLAMGAYFAGRAKLPWSADLLPISLAFLLSGTLLRQRVAALPFRWPYLLLAGALFAGLHLVADAPFDMNGRQYDQFLPATAKIVLGIYLVLALARLLARWQGPAKALSYVGAGTLFILIFHIFFQQHAFDVFARLSGSYPVAGGLSLACGIGLPLVFGEIVKRSRFLSAAYLPARASNTARPPEPVGAGLGTDPPDTLPK